jgi:hypothetical protein
MRHWNWVLIVAAGCTGPSFREIGSMPASSSRLVGDVVHLGMDTMVCAFDAEDGTNLADYSPEANSDSGEIPWIALHDVRGADVLATVEGELGRIDDYDAFTRLFAGTPVTSARWTGDGFVALTAPSALHGCELVNDRGERGRAPACDGLEVIDGLAVIEAHDQLWPIDGVTAGAPRQVDAHWEGGDGVRLEAIDGVVSMFERGVEVGSVAIPFGATDVFALPGGYGARDAVGQVWWIDSAFSTTTATDLTLDGGEVTSGPDGRYVMHQTRDTATWLRVGR